MFTKHIMHDVTKNI